MKNKTINSKIRTSSRLIDNFKINENMLDKETKVLVQELITNYNEAIELRTEIGSLKKDIKSKIKDLKNRIKSLSKSKKIAAKALIRSKKSLLNLTPVVTNKSSEKPSTVSGKKNEENHVPLKRTAQKAVTV